MKAISIKNPYAHEIFTGVKTIEYRTWQTNYRGNLLICSSANPKKSGMLSGYALIVCQIEKIELSDNGVYSWYLSNFRHIKPTPIKGKLNLYEVDNDLIEFIKPEKAKKLYNELAFQG